MSNTHIQSCQEMTAEMQTGWSLILQGYITIRKGITDVRLPSNQLGVLSALMGYTKILVASVLAHIGNYKMIKRSSVSDNNIFQFNPHLPEQSKGQHRLRQLLEPDIDAAPFIGNSVVAEQQILREVATTLSNELVKEIQERSQESISTRVTISTEAEASRRENEMTFALQKYIKTNQLPSVKDESQLRSTVSELRSVNTLLKERSDRLEANSLKLSSDKFSLMADRQQLLQHVRQLESKIINLNHANGFYRKVHRPSSRSTSRQQQTPHMSVSPIPRTISVGGVQMEPEVVEWLKEMYVTLENEEKEKLETENQIPIGPEQQSKTGFAEYVASRRAS